jgi:hypothetical protein
LCVSTADSVILIGVKHGVELHPSLDELVGHDHCILEMHVVVGCSVDQQIVTLDLGSVRGRSADRRNRPGFSCGVDI